MHFGYRNNNPGNLRPSASQWRGQTGVYDSGASGKFLIFDSPVNGIRAVARTIYNYPRLYGVKTLRDFFRVYAPAGDGANKPDSYADYVAERMGLSADRRVDFTSYEIIRAMLPPIIRMETGEDPSRHYNASTYDAAIQATGLVKVPARYNLDDHDPVSGARDGGRSDTEKNAERGMIGSVITGVTGAGTAVAAISDWRIAAIVAGMVVLLSVGAGALYWLVWRNRRQDRARQIVGVEDPA